MSEHSDKHSFCKCPEFSSLRRCGASAAKAKTSRRNNDTCVQSYKYLSDADKKNTFDVDRYLSSMRRKKRRVVSEDEAFELYDIDLSDEDSADQ